MGIRCLTRPVRQTRFLRGLSTASNHPQSTSFWHLQDQAKNDESTRVAVLGGGITGLTYAYLVSKIAPKARVELFERSGRLGGWLSSSCVNVDGHDVIFEHGPRSLRPTLTAAGLATVDLIQELNLQDEVLPTAKDSPAARNRFIYYPDKLTHMPDPRSGITDILRDLRQPAFKGSVLPAAFEFARSQRPQDLKDESIGSFFRRRFSAAMADNLVSAMIHGIYAGSIEELSVKSIMPALWHQETSIGGLTGSVLRNSLNGRKWQKPHDFQLLIDLCRKQRQERAPTRSLKDDSLPSFFKSSIYTFKQGIEQLASTLETALEQAPNVVLHKNTTLSGLKLISDSRHQAIQISTKATNGHQQSSRFTHAASALPAQSLLSACKATGVLTEQEALAHMVPSVTVMVVNLFYRESDLLPEKGFGYLIPRSVSSEENPHRVLGVVFDSDATPGLDAAKGTKLTVMIGGHWWNDRSTYPTAEEGVAISKELISRHLGVQAEPVLTKATLQRECIPQYTVGHHEKSYSLHGLLNGRLGGLLEMIGASWNGVSVNDCIKDAYLAAQRFQHGKAPECSPGTGQAYDFSQISQILKV